MSEKTTKFTCLFNDENKADEFASMFSSLESGICFEIDSQLKERGLKPFFYMFEYDCQVDRIIVERNFLEVEFYHHSEDRFPNSFTQDLIRHGASLLIRHSEGEEGQRRNSFYLNGEKVKSGEIESNLEKLSPQIAFIFGAILKESIALKILDKIGGVNSYIMGAPAFFFLFDYFKFERFKKLFGESDFSLIQINTGNNILIHAIKDGHPDEIEYFVSKGANVNQKNKKGETPVILASKGRSYYPSIMLSEKADYSITDSAGLGPIHHACISGHIVDLQGLLEHGDDLNRISPQGSPRWLAAKHRPESYRYLLKLGAKSIPGEKDYVGDDYQDLITSIEHDDQCKFRSILGSELFEAEKDDVFCFLKYTCIYRRVEIFETIISIFKLDVSAHTLVDNKHLYSFLEAAVHKDSCYELLSIATYLINASNPVDLEENLEELRINRLILYTADRAIPLVEMLANKGVDLSGLDVDWECASALIKSKDPIGFFNSIENLGLFTKGKSSSVRKLQELESLKRRRNR